MQLAAQLVAIVLTNQWQAFDKVQETRRSHTLAYSEAVQEHFTHRETIRCHSMFANTESFKKLCRSLATSEHVQKLLFVSFTS